MEPIKFQRALLHIGACHAAPNEQLSQHMPERIPGRIRAFMLKDVSKHTGDLMPDCLDSNRLPGWGLLEVKHLFVYHSCLFLLGTCFYNLGLFDAKRSTFLAFPFSTRLWVFSATNVALTALSMCLMLLNGLYTDMGSCKKTWGHMGRCYIRQTLSWLVQPLLHLWQFSPELWRIRGRC